MPMDDKNTNQSLIEDLQKEKEKYELELFQDPTDESAKRNLAIVKSALKRYGVKDPDNDSSNSKMADGGMARGKGNKMYQHNYATGGSVTDNLKAIPADNKGLSKLPTPVRNKMGYMAGGGMSKKKGK